MNLFSIILSIAYRCVYWNRCIKVIRFSICFNSVLLLVIVACSPYLYTTADNENSNSLQQFTSCGNSIEYLSDEYLNLDSTFPIHKIDAQGFAANKIPLIENYFKGNINILKKDTVGISLEYQSDTNMLISYLNNVKDSNIVMKDINNIIHASQSLDSSLIYSLCIQLSVIRINSTVHIHMDDIIYSTVVERSKKNIMRTVMKTLPKMRYEYNHILRQNRGVNGKLLLKFTINQTGKVIYLKVLESTLNNCRMENIEVNIIKGCLFDIESNKPNLTTVVYPFVFSQ